MTKTEAIDLLGGSVAKAAEAIGINSQAVSQWPAELPARLIDRVQAALYRKQQTESTAHSSTQMARHD
ncbi:Cro/CI family transcriptional regulator [Comamonas sp. NoAH]|uniref:Cro/CI family transcriptional regulator n=1 Tax=Comamonas halotolerans TaxID=3041496 RepID=UPI0024E1210C|nr:Cro/CI family transcriptional regulator [Comamonas sp. NoAH]